MECTETGFHGLPPHLPAPTAFLPPLPNCSLSVGDGDDNTDAPCRAGHTAPYSQDFDQF